MQESVILKRGSGAGEGHPDLDPRPASQSHPNYQPCQGAQGRATGVEPGGGGGLGGENGGGKIGGPRGGGAEPLGVVGRPTAAGLCLPASRRAASASLA